MNRCRGHSRHWFSVYGMPGLRSPVCRRCGEPNPRPLDESELASYRYAVSRGWARDVPVREQEKS